jgi:RNA polymerase sigma-70 factor (ECF subfamily)
MNSAPAAQDVSAVDFEAVVRACRPYLLQIAVSSARNADDAEDIVQEALTRGFRGIKRFRGDCPVRVWLVRIVVRVAINHHKSVARRLKRWVFFADMETDRGEGAPPRFDPPDPLSDTRDRERMLDVNKQVNRLPDEFRLPLTMLAVDGMTIPEIAGILQIPEGTVKSRIFYARKRLRNALRDRRSS